MPSKKKLSAADYHNMWGEEGPYSQVRLCEETRILDDSVSRVFLVIEAEINPFTFKWAEKNRKKFLDDEPILQLLDHAENRGKHGYVVSAGEVELHDESSRQFARTQAEMTIQTLIRLHTCVINEFGLRTSKRLGLVRDIDPVDVRHIWNEEAGSVEIVEEALLESKLMMRSSEGVAGDTMRYFFILAFASYFDFKGQAVITFIRSLKEAASKFNVVVEDCESFAEHMFLAVLLPMNITAADFIEFVLDKCSQRGIKPLFKKNYLVSNIKRPSDKEILIFLKQASVDD